MRAGPAARALLAAGLAAIREQFEVPGAFPQDALDEADRAARGPWRDGRRDLSHLGFVTLDPAQSTDLDQAFVVVRDGPDVVLHYAIADVDAFVAPGGPIDQEAWRRGATVYLPDAKAGVYPPVLAEGAASLLPDGPRPAVVLTVRIDPAGDAHLEGAERAVITSRAKLAYESVDAAALPEALEELARRVEAAEDRRGASRVEFPEQEVEPDPDHPGSVVLRPRPRLVSEDRNAAMSTAANLAVAAALYGAHVGLFRVQPDPDRRERRMLRHEAAALGISWPEDMGLRQLLPRLDGRNPRHAQLVMEIRRASGGASYEPYQDLVRPWHSALAATYAHATAPLRRLADRYVLAGAMAVMEGHAVPADVVARYGELAEVMAAADQRSARVERAVVDLVEAIVLHGREGEEFDSVVVDAGERGAKIQLLDPPVVASVDATGVEPGAHVRVRLREADPGKRSVRFERIGTDAGHAAIG